MTFWIAVLLTGLVLLGGLVLLAKRQSCPGGSWRGSSLRAETSGQRLVGWMIIILFFGGGGLWAGLAPLASAAIAPGVVSPEGKRKTVQHLEGGIIQAIHVHEGSHVRAGDPLVTLEDTQARAEYGLLRTQSVRLRAIIARLEAEQDGLAELAYPAELAMQAEQAAMMGILATQRELFQTYRDLHERHRDITARRIAQLKAESHSLELQIEALAEQRKAIAAEAATVEHLLREGLARKPRLFALKRERARLQGEYEALRGRIARNRQAIAQTRLERIAADQEDRQRVNRELTAARKQLDEIRHHLPSVEDAVERTAVRAPADGQVVKLYAATVGGVLQPGEPILDLSPSGTGLFIEVKLRPIDIDDIHVGLPARVVLTAYPQRSSPVIHGVVREVSADRLVDEQEGSAYFWAKVTVDRTDLAALGQERIELLAGMPAEVMIMTGNRTLLDYLLRPIYDMTRRAFRE